MEPRDLSIDEILTRLPAPRNGSHPEGVNVLFGDCSVRFIQATISPNTLGALLTRDGGEQINPGAF
jgi:prepilin-type processing-associated H-X9-DG protein